MRSQVRAEKPNPIIFEDAVQRLNAVAMRRGTAAASSLPAALPMLGHTPAQPSSSAFFTGASTRGNSSNSTSSSCSPTSSYGKAGYDFGPLLPEHIVHVGDDRRNDVWGARDAGISAWLWGYDVRSWAEVADRVLLGSQVGNWGGGGRRGDGTLAQEDGNPCCTILGHEGYKVWGMNFRHVMAFCTGCVHSCSHVRTGAEKEWACWLTGC